MRKAALFTIIAIILAFAISGNWYYKNRIAPSKIVNEFLHQLEFRGASRVETHYFFSGMNHIPDFESKYQEQIRQRPDTDKESYFKAWKDVYLKSVQEYIHVTLNHPNPKFMTRRDFVRTYDEFNFSKSEIKSITRDGNTLRATGYIDVEYRRSAMGNHQFGGSRKFQFYARNGPDGWKVLAFTIE